MNQNSFCTVWAQREEYTSADWTEAKKENGVAT